MPRLVLLLILWGILSIFGDVKLSFARSAAVFFFLHVGFLILVPFGIINFLEATGIFALLFGGVLTAIIAFFVFVETLGCYFWIYGAKEVSRYYDPQKKCRVLITRWRPSNIVLGGILWIIGLPETFFF